MLHLLGAGSQGGRGTGFWEKNPIAAGRKGHREVESSTVVQREVIMDLT